MNIEFQTRQLTWTTPVVRTMSTMENVDTAEPSPGHINPIEWHQSMGLARQACARIFRDGGSPGDAMAAFGVAATGDVDWSRAVDIIAEALSTPALRRAA